MKQMRCKRERSWEPLHGDSQEALLPQPLPGHIEEEFELALILEDVSLFAHGTANIAFIDSAGPTTEAGDVDSKLGEAEWRF